MLSEELESSAPITPTVQSIGNLNDLPVMRRRVSYVDQLSGRGEALTEAQAAIDKAGSGQALETAPPPNPAIVVADQPAAAPTQPSQTVPQPTSQTSQPPTAPVLPTDSPRVQDRINKLYAQKRSAEEEAAGLRALILEQSNKIDALTASRAYGPPPSSIPETPPSYVPGEPPAVPAGQYISRHELERILTAERQAAARIAALSNAQIVSRDEAVRDFPDVFADPDLRSAADQVFRSDPAFSGDPNGYYKAAALVRGLQPASRPNPAPVSAAARKHAMSFGPSIPEASAPQPNNVERYRAALNRARQTQRPEDFVLARKIQLGLV